MPQQRVFDRGVAVAWVVVLAAACGGGSNSDAGRKAAIELPRTMQTESKASGDDASQGRGVAWPTPRFTTSDGGATMVDRLTGLMWAGSITPLADCGWEFDTTRNELRKSWQEVASYVECLNAHAYLGHGDWRMPNRVEMLSLLQRGATSGSFTSGEKWFRDLGFAIPTSVAYLPASFVTSTVALGAYQCVQDPQQTSLKVEAVDISGGSCRWAYGNQISNWLVWPVRDAEGVKGAVRLPATGVSACYDGYCNRIDCAGTHQDGETRKGVAWPSPRYVKNKDTTVTDRLTGLVWGPNGNLPNEDPEGEATPSTWLDALAVVDGLNAKKYLGHADWRLPNIDELTTLTLADVEAPNLYSQLGAAGVDVKGGLYWSSSWADVTLNLVAYDGAWTVDMANGMLSTNDFMTTERAQLLPVRGP